MTETPPATLTAMPAPTPAPIPTYPDAVTAVRLILARELSTTMSATKVISYEKVEWPTACLGVQTRGTACADMITPGYRIILEANNATYEYHTNTDGGNYVLAAPVYGRTPGASTSDLALVWHREGGFAGFCDTVIVKKTGSYEVSPCGGRRTPITTTLELDASQMKQLNAWVTRLKPFGIGHVGPVNPDELIVEVSFYGLGVAEPSPDDKQAISDFAQQLRNTIK